MGKTAKIMLYGGYTIVALVFFLVLLFPSNMLKQMVIDKVTATNPAVGVQIETVGLVFPLGLSLAPVSITYDGTPLTTLDHLRLSPKLFSLFSDTQRIIIDGEMGQGFFQGQATVIQDDKRPQTTLALTLTDIPVAMVDAAQQWPQFQPSGQLNAFIDFDSRRGGTGSAQIDLEVISAAVAMNPPLLGLERMDFSQLQADVSLTPRMMQIKRCEATGLQIEGKLTGSVIFRQPMGGSRLSMSCTLKPQPTFVAEHKNDMIGGLLASQTVQKRGMVFRVSGTLDNPRYVMR